MSGRNWSARNVIDDPAGSEGSESLPSNSSSHVRHDEIRTNPLLHMLLDAVVRELDRRKFAPDRSAIAQMKVEKLRLQRMADEQLLNDPVQIQSWIWTHETLNTETTHAIVPASVGRALGIDEMWWAR